MLWNQFVCSQKYIEDASECRAQVSEWGAAISGVCSNSRQIQKVISLLPLRHRQRVRRETIVRHSLFAQKLSKNMEDVLSIRVNAFKSLFLLSQAELDSILWPRFQVIASLCCRNRI